MQCSAGKVLSALIGVFGAVLRVAEGRRGANVGDVLSRKGGVTSNLRGGGMVPTVLNLDVGLYNQ